LTRLTPGSHATSAAISYPHCSFKELRMRRREFIAGLGGAAAWPVVARAQQGRVMRRIGVLMPLVADDPLSQVAIAGFLQGLQELGWSVGRNIRIDYRWGAAGGSEKQRKYAAELIALAPDVILAGTGGIVGALQEETRTVPIVFAAAIDPVGSGRVRSLSRPGTNATGFLSVEYSMGGKLLELLKELAPRITRTAVTRDPATPGGIGLYAAIQTASPSFKLELTPVDLRDSGEIERTLMVFAREPDGGLIVPASARAIFYREMLISLAARYRLPTVYPGRVFVEGGGLVSYGPSSVDTYRRAASYVDRILKGEMPGDLPVQFPTKFEMVVNLKTAKALGLTVPQSLLLRADEVIE
jgi:putative tryptophan/tyrosine transport system substrate-binding protein